VEEAQVQKAAWYQGLTVEQEKIWFEEQIRQCEKDITRFACHITGNMEKAKDIIQEAFLRAYKYRHSYNDKYPFRNWLYAILLNIHRHNCKKEKLIKTIIPWKNSDDEEQDTWDFIESEEEGPEARTLKKQLVVDIEKAIQKLPLKMREVIVLCDMAGYSYEEASEVIHCPLGTIRSRLHRARRQVQKELEIKYGEDLFTSWS